LTSYSQAEIDFEAKCDANKLPCPACRVNRQGVHDSITRSWRQLDFFQLGDDAKAVTVAANCAVRTEQVLLGWISWTHRCRLEPFIRLANTLKERLPGAVRGMLDGRSNAYVESMNSLLQHQAC